MNKPFFFFKSVYLFIDLFIKENMVINTIMNIKLILSSNIPLFNFLIFLYIFILNTAILITIKKINIIRIINH